MSTEFKKICDKIKSADNIVLIAHVNPDGDALGSMAALAWAANKAGKDTNIVLHGELTARPYAHLCNGLEAHDIDQFDTLAARADIVVILDTASKAQLGTLPEKLLELKDKVLVIDHHLTSDQPAAIHWADTSAAAVGIMVMDILDELAWEIDTAMATFLAWAIVTDTGWLRFSNTDGRCLRAMARLIDKGIEPDALYKQIYQNDRPQKLLLIRQALDSLQYFLNGRFAAMTLTLDDFLISAADLAETEGIVNEPMRIGDIEVSLIVVQNPDVVRVSLRSREHIDVSQIAAKFGGGGHARAAGIKFDTQDVEEVKTLVIKELLAAFEKLNK